MNNAQRMDMVTVLARKESEKRFTYCQNMFNFQLNLISVTVRDYNDLFHERHDWRSR